MAESKPQNDLVFRKLQEISEKNYFRLDIFSMGAYKFLLQHPPDIKKSGQCRIFFADEAEPTDLEREIYGTASAVFREEGGTKAA